MTKQESDMERYSRQILLPEIGEEGQKRIAAGRVLIVGAGGLGSPVALYLAAAGVGYIGIADDDVVSQSNLQRQVLYTEDDKGLYKASAAASRLLALNSDICVVPHLCRIDSSNALDLISGYDLVVDCSDNFHTRYILDEVCKLSGRILVYGAIQGFEGQVSVFGRCENSLRYRDLYPTPSDDVSPAVIGMTPAVVGSIMAHEVIKVLCGYGDVLYNKLWTIDLRTMQSYIISL